MADNIYELSTSAGSNSSVGGMNWAEGQAPSTVNDSARQFAALIAQILGDIGGALTAGGTANALTVTANSGFTTHANGRILAFIAASDNTGAATLNVNAIGAKAIRKMTHAGDAALEAGDIQATGIYVVQYNTALNSAAGGWLLVNPMVPRAPTMQEFTGNGTWTKPAGCKYAVFEACGGGGGAGGVDGQGAGTVGATGGGASGFYGKTGYIDVSGTTSAAVTIGAAGAAGAAGANNGGDGGSTAITIGATTYTWGGGGGSPGLTAGEDNIALSGTPATGTNVVGSSWAGQFGVSDFTDMGVAHSGSGGSTPFGTGGHQLHTVSTVATAGNAGAGYGAGGGGAITYASTSNVAGGAGTGGYMRVWEFY